MAASFWVKRRDYSHRPDVSVITELDSPETTREGLKEKEIGVAMCRSGFT